MNPPPDRHPARPSAIRRTESPPRPRRLLGCDWGTTAFRLRLIDVASVAVLAEETSNEGIATTHAAWKAFGAGPSDRWSYFLSVLRGRIAALERTAGTTTSGLPLVISGMASSSIGMRELPYRDMPLATDGSDLHTDTIAASPHFPHEITLISGVRTGDDVMRGEETGLVGAVANEASPGADRVFVFPGTHSKHVAVSGGQARRLRTYMTGELLELLSCRSVLADSVAESEGAESDEDREGFEAGAREGARTNLLHGCFRVRTRALLDGCSKTSNHRFLGGVLIGSELAELASGPAPGIVVVADPPLAGRYREVLRILGRGDRVEVRSASEALVRGQWMIAARRGLLG